MKFGGRAWGALLLLALGSNTAFAATQPNILFILADDVGAEASSLYPLAGVHGAAPMPNIEKLAARGLTFENTWVNPMCSPTRATVLTGLYGHHNGVLTAGDVLAPETTMLWDYLNARSPARYDMAVFGKWHLGGNGGDIQHVQAMRAPNFRGILGVGVSDYFKWTAWDGATGTSAEMTTYSTTVLTDWAIEFIERHKAARPQDPWFVYLPYNAAHAPFQVPPANLHSVDVGDLAPGDKANSVPVYKAMIQALDTEIGRLLQHVDLRNTLVIYLGDNGTQSNVKDEGSKVRGSKISAWEGGAKVPLTVAGAGVTRIGREPALVNGTDLFATIASAAGIPVSHVNDSYDISPLFSNAKVSSGRRFGFTELCSANASRYAVRDMNYKLIYDNKDGWGLYNLAADQGEQHNLYDADMPDVKAARTALKDALGHIKDAATGGCFQ